MFTVLVTGGMGSGKSAVCKMLAESGVPVYDCDSRVKRMYESRPSLLEKLETALGKSLRTAGGSLDKAKLSASIFGDDAARMKVESVVYPVLLADIRRWKTLHRQYPLVAVESAIMLSKPIFDGVYDGVVLVDAPLQARISRVAERSGLSREEALRRMVAQEIPYDRAGAAIVNDGTPQELAKKVASVFFDKNGYICKILNEDRQ